MIEPFSAWVGFQEEMLKLQKAQLDAAKKAIEAGAHMAAAQQAGGEAASAGLKAWANWFDLWAGRR